jgi:2'-5' RNA ligase
MRLFVAAALPADVRALLAGYGAAAAAAGAPGGSGGGGGWRAVRRENVHVTLAFLGERSEADADSVAAGVAQAVAGVGAVEGLSLGKAVVLGRVLAVRMQEPAGALAALQASVSEVLAARELYVPERRRWLAHATVARQREAGRGRGRRRAGGRPGAATPGAPPSFPSPVPHAPAAAAAGPPPSFPPPVPDASFRIDEVVVFVSRLRPTGSEYSPLASFALR